MSEQHPFFRLPAIAYPIPDSVLDRKLAARRSANLGDPEWFFSPAARARRLEIVHVGQKVVSQRNEISQRQSSTYSGHLRQEHEQAQLLRRLREAGGEAAVQDPESAARQASLDLYGERPQSRMLTAILLAVPAVFAGWCGLAVFDTASLLAVIAASVLWTSAVIFGTFAARALLDQFSATPLYLTEDDFQHNFEYIARDSEGGRVAEQTHHVVAAIIEDGKDTVSALGHTTATLQRWRDRTVARAASLQNDLDTLDEVEDGLPADRHSEAHTVREATIAELDAVVTEIRELEQRAHIYRTTADTFTETGDEIVRRADESLARDNRRRRAESALYEIAEKRRGSQRRPDVTE